MKGKKIVSKGIDISGEYYLFSEILTKFAKTSYGITLRSNIRFSDFKPQDLSNEMWTAYLGKDVNNLFHLEVAHLVTRNFLLGCANPSKEWQGEISQEARFTQDEQQQLLFTSVVHDWAEAIIGDIPAISKTASDECKEMIILRQQLREILGNSSNLQEIEYLSDTVVSILTDRSTKLGKAFNAIERIGYLRTAIKAWYFAKKTDGELREKLQYLTDRVVVFNIPKLLDYATMYPAIHSYLLSRQKPITEAITQFTSDNDKIYEKWLQFLSVVLLFNKSTNLL